MIILGIDTSCDDTSVAIIDDKKKIFANVVSSQADLHSLFGGVVPEIASRKHVELIEDIYKGVLKNTGISPEDIDLISVTSGPGLIGSVLVGLCFAKGLSLSLKKPIIGINHIEAHAMSIFLEREVQFPFIALVVSGGHTMILLIEDCCSFRVLGSTRDDAAGEAFDKIAKYLGIGYPGGKIIEDYALHGDENYVYFPRPMIDDNNYDFSFSGLKTAFVNYVKKNSITNYNLKNILASFQRAVCDVLVWKTIRAARDNDVRRVVVGGGVAANNRLREVFREEGEKRDVDIMFSSPDLCSDNGAMVAILGWFYFRKGIVSSLDVKGFSRMAIK